MSTAPRPRGFLTTLFDATFSHLLALRLVRVLYLLALITIGTIGFILLFSSFAQGGAVAVVGLVVVPTLTLLCIGLVRVVLEAVVVIFRMGADAEQMSRTLYRMSNPPRTADRDGDD